MKYESCSRCLRANSPLCEKCQYSDLYLSNDKREYWYKLSENGHTRGPEYAFLLPYKGVYRESYVWTVGMNKWDFAENVLGAMKIRNFDYCPICDGLVSEKYGMYIDDPNEYTCQQCGFTFFRGGTRSVDPAQMEYLGLLGDYAMGPSAFAGSGVAGKFPLRKRTIGIFLKETMIGFIKYFRCSKKRNID